MTPVTKDTSVQTIKITKRERFIKLLPHTKQYKVKWKLTHCNIYLSSYEATVEQSWTLKKGIPIVRCIRVLYKL